jgi:hypothetical protein
VRGQHQIQQGKHDRLMLAGKERDFLLDAILEHGKFREIEVEHESVRAIGHRHIQRYDIDAGSEGGRRGGVDRCGDARCCAYKAAPNTKPTAGRIRRRRRVLRNVKAREDCRGERSDIF